MTHLKPGSLALAWLLFVPLTGCGDDDSTGDNNNQNGQPDAAVQLDGDTTTDGAASDADVTADASTTTGCTFAGPTAWAATTALPAPRESFATVTHSGHVIVLGGWTQTGATDSVISAPATDGTLGAWQTTTPLPVSREHLAAAMVGNRVVVTGGDDGAGGFPTVHTATVSGGQVSAWTETTPLPLARLWHAMASHGNHVYVIGGMDGFGGSAADTVYRGTLDGSGAITAWTPDTPLAMPTIGHAALVTSVIGDTLYIVGGGQGLGVSTSGVFATPINPDGSLEGWNLQTPLPDPNMTPGAIAVADQVLAVGGLVSFNTASDQTLSLPLGPTMPPWTPHAALPQTIFGHGLVRVGDHAFALGGWGGYTTQPQNLQSGVYSARVCQ